MTHQTFAALTTISFLCGAAVAGEPRLSADRLFDPDHIVEVSIELPEDEWDKVRLQTRSIGRYLVKNPPDSPFRYQKANITIDGVRIEDVAIRKKGFLGSLDDNRPSLKVRFDKYVDQNPIAGLDRLTLNNNKQDISCLSQYLGYRFFNQTGTAACRSNLAKVTVNGRYLGIYSNVESIRQPMLERTFGDSSGALYEGTVVDFFPDFVNKFERKNKAAKTNLIQQITDALHADKVELEVLEQLIDIPAFINFWATESLTGFWDGYSNNQNNFFMYQNPSNGKLYFLPWGADALFQEGSPIPPYRVSPRHLHHQAMLCNELYRVPKYRSLYYSTLENLLKEHWNEDLLLAEVERMEARIEPLLRSDNNEFDKGIERLKRFIKQRRALLEREMKDGPVELKTRGRRPAYFAPNGEIRIEYQTQWYDRSPDDAESLGDVKITVDLDGENVEFSRIGAYSEHSKWPPLPPNVPKPPTVIFKGFRKSDDKEILIAVGLPIKEFVPRKKPASVNGMMFIGPIFRPGTETRMLSGEATFSSAAMKKKAAVAGKLKLITTEMRGGKPIE